MSFSIKNLRNSLDFIVKETVHKSFAFIHKMNCFLDIPTHPSAIWRQDLNGNKIFIWVDDHKETFWALDLQRLLSNPFYWIAVHQVKFSWKMFSLWNWVVSTYILEQCFTEGKRVAEHSPSKMGSDPKLPSQLRCSHWGCPPSIQLREMFASVLFLQPYLIAFEDKQPWITSNVCMNRFLPENRGWHNNSKLLSIIGWLPFEKYHLMTSYFVITHCIH